MFRELSLSQLGPGMYGKITAITAEGASRRRLMDLGLVQGTVVEAVRRNPSGDPTAYKFRGAVVALRREEASRIIVRL